MKTRVSCFAILLLSIQILNAADVPPLGKFIPDPNLPDPLKGPYHIYLPNPLLCKSPMKHVIEVSDLMSGTWISYLENMQCSGGSVVKQKFKRIRVKHVFDDETGEYLFVKQYLDENDKVTKVKKYAGKFEGQIDLREDKKDLVGVYFAVSINLVLEDESLGPKSLEGDEIINQVFYIDVSKSNADSLFIAYSDIKDLCPKNEVSILEFKRPTE